MTINDYFNDYKTNSAFPLKLYSGGARTIKGFYDDFISKTYQDTGCVNNIIKWHEMLVEYTKDDSNIFWVRKYESGLNGKTNDNRRASVVEFEDSFKIVYVSNFDAQEILNMALVGVEADINLFTKKMKDYTYPFHYRDSAACTEYDTHKYPLCGNYLAGVLTQACMYLAHIRSVNEMPYFINGNNVSITSDNKTLQEQLFPYGIKEDWTNSSDHIKHVNYSLTSEEKAIIKAHFLRFVDPLNYFPVPGEKFHLYEYSYTTPHYKNIGEFPLMVSFMYKKMKEIFTSIDFDVFDKQTLFDKNVLSDYRPNEDINIVYRVMKKYKKLNKKASSTNSKQASKPHKTTAHTSRSTITEDLLLEIANDYLFNSTALIPLEKKYLGKDNHGATAKNYLDKIGLTSNKKGALKGQNIDAAINAASGVYKDTLIKIKDKYHY